MSGVCLVCPLQIEQIRQQFYPLDPEKGIGSEGSFLLEVIDSSVILYGIQKGIMKYAREVLSENVKNI